MQARPVYVAAVDISCKILYSPLEKYCNCYFIYIKLFLVNKMIYRFPPSVWGSNYYLVFELYIRHDRKHVDASACLDHTLEFWSSNPLLKCSGWKL